MLRMASFLAALAAVGAALVGASLAADTAKPFPEVIQLPTGFRPEGIEIGRGTTFYVGSVASGAIYSGDLRTGTRDVLVPGGNGRPATGIELDRHNRLFVAGAGTGNAYVYAAGTGALLRTYNFGASPTFINDVVVTHGAAYFTDSQQADLYRVPIGPGGVLGAAETIHLGGEYAHVGGGAFNLNGIDATRNGKTLVAVQSTGGKLYLVQNQLNQVAVIALGAGLTSGKVLTRLTDSDFKVPTTIDDLGRRLYAVNARFGTPDPDTLEFQVVQLRKPRGS